MNQYLFYWGKAQPTESSTAKWHPLAYHSLDVASVVRAYLSLNPSVLRRLSKALGTTESKALSFATFLAAAHDLGKFSLTFQFKDAHVFSLCHSGEVPPAGSEHHSQSGLPVLIRWALDTQVAKKDECLREEAEEVWEPILNATCGHHGFPVGHNGVSDLQGKGLVAAHAYLNDVWDLLGRPGFPRLDLGNGDIARASMLLAGVISVCDWVGSSQALFPYSAPGLSLREYWELSEPKGMQAIKELSLGAPPLPTVGGLAHLFPHFQATATPLQRYADTVEIDGESSGPVLYVLEDETGSGKTEAALTLASRLVASGKSTGVMVSLPTQTTADAFCRRMLPLASKIMGARGTFTLSHGNAKLSLERLSGERAIGSGIEVELRHWASESNKTAFLSDLGVCTIDQVVLSALPSKHFAMRQLGLGQKVLVVDEAHSCEPYLLKLLERALELHASRGGSAIVLSATLPLKTRQSLLAAFARGASYGPPIAKSLDYPLATSLTARGVIEHSTGARSESRVVSLERLAEGDVQPKIDALLKEGRCVLLLRNTVASAQAAYEQYSARHPGKVFLAHARFVSRHRAENDSLLLDRFGKQSTGSTRVGQLVISTQVAEQSLDVDFDELITDIAPIDSLLQRIGRRRRHVRDTHGGYLSESSARDSRPQSPVWVVMPCPVNNDKFLTQLPTATGYVYDMPSVLLRTAELVEKGTLKIPSQVRDAVEYAYDESASIPISMARAQEKSEGKTTDARKTASSKSLTATTAYSAALMSSYLPGDAVTRLGEPSMGLVLCDEHHRPLFGSAELSTVRLRRSLLEAPFDSTGSINLALKQVGPFNWECSAKTPEGKFLVVTYCRYKGLKLQRPR